MSTTPHMVEMDSSNVKAIGHHGDELHVQFKNGGHYVYRGVPSSLYHEALGSDSVGKFIGARIRDKFAHHKI